MSVISSTINHKSKEFVDDFKKLIDKHGVILTLDHLKVEETGEYVEPLLRAYSEGNFDLEIYQDDLDTFINGL